MARLPLPPPGVVGLTAAFYIDGATASITNYIAAPGSDVCTAPELEALRALFVAGLLDWSNATTHLGCSVVRVDLERWDPLPLRVSGAPATNAGSWTGGQVATAASVVAWLTEHAGRGSTGRTFMPGLPDEFTDDHVNMNATGTFAVQQAGQAWVEYVNGVAGPSGGDCVHGVLSRVDGGSPLTTAVFFPTMSVRASFKIGTLDRRRTTRS